MVKPMRFARNFSKLDDAEFSTVRPRGKYVVDDHVDIIRPDHEPRRGIVRFVWPYILDTIDPEFLAHDTDTTSKEEAIAVLRGFYPNLNVNDTWDIVRVRYTGSPSLDANIRLDCYMSVLARFKTENPQAHFEVVTRQDVNSPLSPSWPLLKAAKAGEMTFDEYLVKLRAEIKRRPEARELLGKLWEIAMHRVVFLVCFEKDPLRCHRSLVKQLILEHAGE